MVILQQSIAYGSLRICSLAKLPSLLVARELRVGTKPSGDYIWRVNEEILFTHGDNMRRKHEKYVQDVPYKRQILLKFCFRAWPILFHAEVAESKIPYNGNSGKIISLLLP